MKAQLMKAQLMKAQLMAGTREHTGFDTGSTLRPETGNQGENAIPGAFPGLADRISLPPGHCRDGRINRQGP
jgi:hypothetical protein